jgi:hypothetical protein
MRRGAGRYEQLEVVRGGRPKVSLTALRLLLEHVHRLARPVLSRLGQPLPSRAPEVRDGPLLADHEPRAAPRNRLRERVAAAARRHEIRAHVAQGYQPPVLLEAGEAPEPAPRHVLEEHALDRILAAVGEDLVEGRLLQRGHTPRKL